MRASWTSAMLVVGLWLAFATAASTQENTALSLKDVPVGIPTAAIIPAGPPPDSRHRSRTDRHPRPGDRPAVQGPGRRRHRQDQAALVRLGKALFWDMQAGSDGVQSCATCHFNAGADSRSKNQISPGLHDTNFTGPFISGDNHFGNSTVPYTARDPHTPNPPGPSEPPLAEPRRAGICRSSGRITSWPQRIFRSMAGCDRPNARRADRTPPSSRSSPMSAVTRTT